MNDMNILKNIYVLLIERNRRKEVEINANQDKNWKRKSYLGTLHF